MSHTHKIPVTFFFRKPQVQYFSIEKVFEQVIGHLPESIQPHIYRLKNGTNGWWGRMKALIEARRHKGTINHITGDITFIALVLPKRGLIVTFHDLESLMQYKGWQFRILKFLWVIIPVKRARVVTAISEHTKEQLIKWTQCNPNKIVVIPNPVPDEVVYAPKTFDAQNPTVLIMGTKANKNVEGIFKAAEKLEAPIEIGGSSKLKGEGAVLKVENLSLIVVGKMTEEQTALVKKYQLKVENLVQVSYEEVLAAYQRCDMLCFPSFYEGFGLPIIEAQATGRPVITSNYGAMKEVAGEGALLVNPYKIDDVRSAILDVLTNAELRKQLVEKGLKNVERFRAKKVGERYGEVYRT